MCDYLNIVEYTKHTVFKALLVF